MFGPDFITGQNMDGIEGNFFFFFYNYYFFIREKRATNKNNKDPYLEGNFSSVGYLYVKCGHLIRFHKNLHATCERITTIELTLGVEVNALSHLSYNLEDP